MSGIWLSRNELVTTTGEIVGHKSGLALTLEELSRLVPQYLTPIWAGSAEEIVRIRPEEFEDLVAAALHGVGNLPTPSTAPPGIRQFHKYRDDPEAYAVLQYLMGTLPDFLNRGMEEAKASGKKAIDPTPFFEDARRAHGLAGAEMALELIEDLDLHFHRSPWSQYRRVEWRDTADLRELFDSESLESYYGSFIDQRFVDYLAQNFDDIDRMNWRKFEGLTCEFFDRAGFHVEIGEGRGDGNIDARIWPNRESRELPPTVLVQCKRQKEKVGKVVVKALWADMLAEEAESGLIVTTNALAPGAERVCVARGYPIDQAKRDTLRKWVQAMRTPATGVILGE